MARPALDQTYLTVMVSFKTTSKNRDQIEARAKSLGLSRSDYLRDLTERDLAGVSLPLPLSEHTPPALGAQAVPGMPAKAKTKAKRKSKAKRARSAPEDQAPAGNRSGLRDVALMHGALQSLREEIKSWLPNLRRPLADLDVLDDVPVVLEKLAALIYGGGQGHTGPQGGQEEALRTWAQSRVRPLTFRLQRLRALDGRKGEGMLPAELDLAARVLRHAVASWPLAEGGAQ